MASGSTKPKRPYAERNGRLMTYEDVADELAITVAMVDKLVRDGELTRVRHRGKIKRILRKSVDNYIERLAAGAQ